MFFLVFFIIFPLSITGSFIDSADTYTELFATFSLYAVTGQDSLHVIPLLKSVGRSGSISLGYFYVRLSGFGYKCRYLEVLANTKNYYVFQFLYFAVHRIVHLTPITLPHCPLPTNHGLVSLPLSLSPYRLVSFVIGSPTVRPLLMLRPPRPCRLVACFLSIRGHLRDPRLW